LKEALKIDPNNYETLQVYASFKISQQKPEEALALLEQSYQQWKPIQKKLQTNEQEDTVDEQMNNTTKTGDCLLFFSRSLYH
jgi:cytochrome c-type biogenesis protein CcmH/NrfG